MKGADGKPLKIVEKIAACDYTTFGMCLLQDENGLAVALLKRDHINDGAESVTEAILQKWLTSDAPTRTYQHLIECLRQSELGALAELIANTTGKVNQISFNKKIKCRQGVPVLKISYPNLIFQIAPLPTHMIKGNPLFSRHRFDVRHCVRHR